MNNSHLLFINVTTTIHAEIIVFIFPDFAAKEKKNMGGGNRKLMNGKIECE